MQFIIKTKPRSNNYSSRRCWCRSTTSDAGLPDGVGVAEAGDDVVGDGEGELEPVGAAFLEREPRLLAAALGLRRQRQRQHHVRPPGRQDGQARDLHVRLQRLCAKFVGSSILLL